MDEDGNRSISRPLNFFCMCGIGIFVFFSFESSQSNCSRLVVHECTQNMDKCNQQSVDVDCDCMSAYVECLLASECDQAYPSRWSELISQCLESSCSPEQCQFGRENSSPPPENLPPPVTPISQMLDISSECNRCYTTLTACQSHPHSIDCYCIEDFMACTNDLNCLTESHREVIVSDCKEQWKCSEMQCVPNHHHGRVCEYKGKGILLICGTMLATALALMIFHIICFQHLWNSPLNTQEIGTAVDGRRSLFFGCLFGPVTLLCGALKHSQFAVSGLFLGSAVFNLMCGVLLFAIYLYPFIHFQRNTTLQFPLNTICTVQTVIAFLGAVCFSLSICSAVTFCFKYSRLRATGYSIVSTATASSLSSQSPLQTVSIPPAPAATQTSGGVAQPHETLVMEMSLRNGNSSAVL